MSMSKAAFPFLPAGAVLLMATLAACTDAPSWETILTAKIIQQYPSYQLQAAPDGALRVVRPGKPPVTVDVKGIASYCQRGVKDCNYAIDQMLLGM